MKKTREQKAKEIVDWVFDEWDSALEDGMGPRTQAQFYDSLLKRIRDSYEKEEENS